MKKIGIALIAGVLLIVAAPAVAQVGIEVGPRGVGVEVDRDRDRDYRRDRRYEERREYRRYDGDRYSRGERCRTEVIRTRRPDGDVVIRRIRRCR
jgi:hypothetical protein